MVLRITPCFLQNSAHDPTRGCVEMRKKHIGITKITVNSILTATYRIEVRTILVIS